ncbi:trypsin 5G1 [Microplitis demolitor]|uniref:trypsin 5G1 n=1 Tax=Microplitis demolitor TaxID=69319 RepID=UPI0004CDA1F3|nr:trypsin 5G1 [Microplitis demolitor]
MANKPSRIVGGESARIEDWPAVVVVRNILTNETCGGVLISHKHVLTVAHCIVSGREEDDPSMDQLEYYKVRSGSSSCKNMDQDKWIPVVTINIHRFFLKYPPTPDADIAILELKRTLDLEPALIPTRQFREGETGTILGCGWTKPEDSSSVDDLKKASMTITKVDDSSIKAIATTGIAFCYGDSGGPFLIGNTVVGIISNSFDCTGNTPGSYTNVYTYTTWIDDVLTYGGQSIFSGDVKIRKNNFS